MKIDKKIAVIIATSLGRVNTLFERALSSVLKQTSFPNFILIVDDNDDKNISDIIQTRLEDIKVNSKNDYPAIFYIKNVHTRAMSGTGAWNTAFDFCKNILSDDDYIAILDDDDSWEKTYIEKCRMYIDKRPDQIIAFLHRSDCNEPSYISKECLKVENFLLGNPGVQGSNMFFRFSAIKIIGGFDETLASCTDRDFMIRFLTEIENPKIEIIHEVLVEHFAGEGTVTYDRVKKQKGLDAFYKKHIRLFDKDILNASLKRTEKLFYYANVNNIKKFYALTHDCLNTEKIVIGVALHNNKSTIRNTIQSIFNQKNVKSEIWVLIVNDDSTDDWMVEINDILNNEHIIYWNVNFHNVSKVRNYINNFIKTHFSNVLLIGRLDADDVYAERDVLSNIEKKYLESKPDFIIAGNYLKLEGKILSKINRAKKELLDHDFLLNLLKDMAEEKAENELPSCNLFMTPKAMLEYPNKKSAEDHFLVSYILWNSNKYKVLIAEDILLTVYSLDGSLSFNNKKENNYYAIRKELYEEASKNFTF